MHQMRRQHLDFTGYGEWLKHTLDTLRLTVGSRLLGPDHDLQNVVRVLRGDERSLAGTDAVYEM